MASNTSVKHNQIEKINRKMFILVAIAAVTFSFSVVASLSLFNRLRYQDRVIEERKMAENDLQKNLDNLNKLTKSYNDFDAPSVSVIQTNEKNSKIVLDALPSKYDFPALAVSMEKLMRDLNLRSIGFSGKDEEVAAVQSSADPKPIEIPFSLTGSGNYDVNIQKLVTDIQRSIRPIVINRISISGNQADISYVIDAKTYYQPSKKLEIPLKDIE